LWQRDILIARAFRVTFLDLDVDAAMLATSSV
jgi:hypothetical protein